jgi:hypothetical protein
LHRLRVMPQSFALVRLLEPLGREGLGSALQCLSS